MNEKTETQPRKMPRRIAKLVEEIVAHPFYQQTDESFRFAFGFGAYGYSQATRRNNKWFREIWSYMYADGPKPCENWPEKVPVHVDPVTEK